MATKGIFKQTVEDYMLIFSGFLNRSKETKKAGIVRPLVSLLIVLSALFVMIGFPYLQAAVLRHGAKDIHLNLYEINDGQHFDNVSYLCKFEFKRHEDPILNYTMSEDGREVVLSFPEGDVKKKNCKEYKQRVPYSDINFLGTTINVFYSRGVEYSLLTRVGNRKNMLIRAGGTLRVIIQNKNAVLVHNTNLTASLVRDLLPYNREIIRISAKSQAYIDYIGTFNFKRKDGSDIIATITGPTAYAYEAPLLDEVNFTSLATFESSENKFVTNLGFKEKRGQDVRNFVKFGGKLLSDDPQLAAYNGLVISKSDYIDPDHVPRFRTSFWIGASVVGSLIGLFFILFIANLLSAILRRRKAVKEARTKTVDKNLVTRPKND